MSWSDNELVHRDGRTTPTAVNPTQPIVRRGSDRFGVTVTETATSAPVYPPGRYGRRRERQRAGRGRVLALAGAGTPAGAPAAPAAGPRPTPLDPAPRV